MSESSSSIPPGHLCLPLPAENESTNCRVRTDRGANHDVTLFDKAMLSIIVSRLRPAATAPPLVGVAEQVWSQENQKGVYPQSSTALTNNLINLLKNTIRSKLEHQLSETMSNSSIQMLDQWRLQTAITGPGPVSAKTSEPTKYRPIASR